MIHVEEMGKRWLLPKELSDLPNYLSELSSESAQSRCG